MATIKPCNNVASHRTGTLIDVDRKLITKLIGFEPNHSDDPQKVTASWEFTVDGVECAVWDYKGSFAQRRASCFGPTEALRKVFGDHVERPRHGMTPADEGIAAARRDAARAADHSGERVEAFELTRGQWHIVVEALRVAADTYSTDAHNADMGNAPRIAEQFRKQRRAALALHDLIADGI